VERHFYPWTLFSVSYHYQDQTKHVGIAQSGHKYHRIKMKLVLTVIWLKNSVKHQSLITHSISYFGNLEVQKDFF